MVESVGSKGVFNATTGTDMGEHSFRGYTKQGVVDSSKAIKTQNKFDLGTNIAQTGIDAAKAYDKASSLKEVAGAVGGVIEDQQARSLEGQQQLMQGVAADQASIQGSLSDAGYDETYPTMLNQELSNNIRGVKNDLVDKTTRLTRAREQGVMTDFELKERLAKITREAMSANPAYSQEIMAHVGQVASVNNLSARVARDQSVIASKQSAAEWQEKKLVEVSLKEDIDVFNPDGRYMNEDGSLNQQKLSEEVSKIQLKKQAYNEYDIADKTNAKIQGMNIDRLVNTGKPSMLNDAVVANLDAQFANILSGDMKAGEKSLAMQRLVALEQSKMNRFYVRNGVLPNDPKIKDYITMANSRISAMQGIYNKMADGSIDATEAKNKLDIIKNTAESSFLEANPDVIHLTAYANIISEMSPLAGATGDLVAVQKRILGALNDYSGGMNDPENIQKNKNMGKVKGLKDTPHSKLTQEYAKELNENPDNESAVKAVEKSLNTRATYITVEDDIADPKKQVEEAQSLIKDLNDPNVEAAINMTKNPEVLSKLATVVTDYAPLVKNAVSRFKEMFPEAELVRHEGTGLVMVKEYKPKYKNFNDNDLKTLNQTIKAWSVVNGEEPDSPNAAEFFADIMSQPLPQTMESTGGNPAETFKDVLGEPATKK